MTTLPAPPRRPLQRACTGRKATGAQTTITSWQSTYWAKWMRKWDKLMATLLERRSRGQQQQQPLAAVLTSPAVSTACNSQAAPDPPGT